jgi:hypothetical protein
VTATGVVDPEDELTDPDEVERPELEELLVDEESEVELDVASVDDATALEALTEELPGIVWAPTQPRTTTPASAPKTVPVVRRAISRWAASRARTFCWIVSGVLMRAGCPQGLNPI